MKQRLHRVLEALAPWAWRVGAAAIKSGALVGAVWLVEKTPCIGQCGRPVGYLDFWAGGFVCLMFWRGRR